MLFLLFPAAIWPSQTRFQFREWSNDNCTTRCVNDRMHSKRPSWQDRIINGKLASSGVEHVDDIITLPKMMMLASPFAPRLVTS